MPQHLRLNESLGTMLDAILRSWPIAPWLTIVLLSTAALYANGWRELHRRDPDRWNAGRLAAFVGGLLTIYLALASPIEVFASFLLTAHMLQHLLLLMVAPPLIWLGWPLFPIIRGLPEPVRVYWAAPLLRSRALKQVAARLVYPLVAWPIFVAATWLWHLPPAYNLGLVSNYWHVVQHTCFTAAAFIFWYPVVRPYPSRPTWSKWWLLPYLLLADIQNTLLAAWLTFSPRVLYAHYSQMPRLDGISAIDDQHAAGVLMWVPGSIALLVPLFWIAITYLMPPPRRSSARTRAGNAAKPIRLRRFDLLNVPGVGRFLGWRHSRRVLQMILLLGTAIVIADGLWGPQVAPMNLAGVVPWIHWRGVLILSLLVAGNFFCMACPFTLPRSLAKRLLPSGRPWPSWLRNKWLVVFLIAIFLWSYEAFSLWNNPWITAWIAIGYFVAAFAIDSFFTGGSFCKYVCPIGQFNFVQSLVSPLTVAVRSPHVCATCTTRECIVGSVTVGGCTAQLFQPQKVGNMDCTFCLDCVHACPHTNIGILASLPSSTLWTDPVRSGIGRFSQRTDLAALVIVLVFGAFANAAGMVGPVVEWQDRLHQALGNPPLLLVTSVSYLFAIVLAPLIAVTLAAFASRIGAGLDEPIVCIITRFAYALIPLGFGMWLAHYSFHFFTSWQSILPVTQRFLQSHGWMGFGDPNWICACCSGAAAWIPRAELLLLDLGFLGSLYTTYRIAESNTADAARAIKSFAPWAILITLLFIAGVWIVFQPMEMRGTLPLAQ